jgi:hypothetical protein
VVSIRVPCAWLALALREPRALAPAIDAIDRTHEVDEAEEPDQPGETVRGYIGCTGVAAKRICA